MDGTRSGSSGWLGSPCLFYLSRSYATKCCACDKHFGFMRRGYTCEFCGYFCHKGGPCSRKVWLSRELLRRRICSKCDCYRKVCTQLREGKAANLRCCWGKPIYVLTGAEFTLHEKSCSKTVTLRLSESRGELLILENEKSLLINNINFGIILVPLS